jgi:hypothetical protein
LEIRSFFPRLAWIKILIKLPAIAGVTGACHHTSFFSHWDGKSHKLFFFIRLALNCDPPALLSSEDYRCEPLCLATRDHFLSQLALLSSRRLCGCRDTSCLLSWVSLLNSYRNPASAAGHLCFVNFSFLSIYTL